MKNVALIMAAGNSSRCGFDKLTAKLKHTTVLERCLKTFKACPAIDEIWVVGQNMAAQGKIKGSIVGGDSRFLSVKAGLEHCSNHYEANVRIVVHNAANPFLNLEDLNESLKIAQTKKNLIFGFFTPNAIKQVTEEGVVSKFLDREHIFESQTPQISTLSTFEKALDTFRVRTQNTNASTEPRDEAELLALAGETIHIYECDLSNTKITFGSDLDFSPKLRLGCGEDSHRFSQHFDPQKPFRLGGVEVSENRLSSDGNSDGDLIVHSLCNALLSAYGEKTFDPIAAPICASGETNSQAYFQATLQFLERQNYSVKIKQLLISLEGAQPKVAPHHEAITSNLANWLSIDASHIGLTYTSGEGLTEFGKGLGMRCQVLITLQDD